MNNHLHIVSFDVPFPPDYGGVIDVYCKIKALSDAGVNIHLHCFRYGRPQAKELERICFRVKYYERKTSKTLWFNKLPYIVVSRRSELLRSELLKDNFPILFEGLHTCSYLLEEDFKNRKTAVRLHNVEHDYYRALAVSESNSFKKIYFQNEAGKLRKFENVLHRPGLLFAISPDDFSYFSKKFKNVKYLPAFHPNDRIEIGTSTEKFALYHGNLKVAENNEAAMFLVNEVFAESKEKLVIAGNSVSGKLRRAVKKHRNILLKEKIGPEELTELVRIAHVNILPTFQKTGIKLKLLFALFNGHFCLVNSPMVKNTGLENLCLILDSPEEIRSALTRLMKQDFPSGEISKREKFLIPPFSNSGNAKKIVEWIFNS